MIGTADRICQTQCQPHCSEHCQPHMPDASKVGNARTDGRTDLRRIFGDVRDESCVSERARDQQEISIASGVNRG